MSFSSGKFELKYDNDNENNNPTKSESNINNTNNSYDSHKNSGNNDNKNSKNSKNSNAISVVDIEDEKTPNNDNNVVKNVVNEFELKNKYSNESITESLKTETADGWLNTLPKALPNGTKLLFRNCCMVATNSLEVRQIPNTLALYHVSFDPPVDDWQERNALMSKLSHLNIISH